MSFTEWDTRVAVYAVILDEAGRVLVSWFVGSDRAEPGWTLPGGQVDYGESLEDALVREVIEETGYRIRVDRLLAAECVAFDPLRPPRPYRAVRIAYAARIVGGSLGTTEIGGSTERADWLAVEDVLADSGRSDVIDFGVAGWRQSVGTTP